MKTQLLTPQFTILARILACPWHLYNNGIFVLHCTTHNAFRAMKILGSDAELSVDQNNQNMSRIASIRNMTCIVLDCIGSNNNLILGIFKLLRCSNLCMATSNPKPPMHTFLPESPSSSRLAEKHQGQPRGNLTIKWPKILYAECLIEQGIFINSLSPNGMEMPEFGFKLRLNPYHLTTSRLGWEKYGFSG